MTVTPFEDVNAKPDEDVIRELEAALELARKGDLRSVAIIGDLTGHRTLTSFTTDDMQDLVGKLTFLSFTICARQRETRE